MNTDRSRSFLRGLGAGLAGSLVGAGALLYVLSRNRLVTFSDGLLPDPSSWLGWAYTNLGSSIPVFAGLLLAYGVSFARLRASLRDEAPIERIVQLDHLTDIWTALFFGTGVIWTAIGMRSALIFALGDPDATVQAGAFAVLQRLVDGGILVALSTTIFGGVGGYLMRVYKSVSIGSALQHRYDRAARVDSVSIRDTLHRIEARLSGRGLEPAEPDR
ncbi:MAG: hypothetical protein OEW35_21375 [Gammaproteobacteria bacterium]|nr:hypothetical protein [Gammaproteobacteria bacterium]MDH4256605.1 hypothetical protein [Gammaproteobacteria bacterium]